MTDYTCSVEECATTAYSQGWCRRHHARWKKHGDPEGGTTHYSSPDDAFAARTEWVGDCLVWTAGKCGGGYGNIRVEGRMVPAHRYSWTRENGPIPDGMWIDHTCFNRACVNVGHLRLATRTQNNRYREGATVQSSSKVRNVYQTTSGKFQVKLGVSGKVLHFGTYDTLEEAESVATAKREELFGEFAGGGR